MAGLVVLVSLEPLDFLEGHHQYAMSHHHLPADPVRRDHRDQVDHLDRLAALVDLAAPVAQALMVVQDRPVHKDHLGRMDSLAGLAPPVTQGGQLSPYRPRLAIKAHPETAAHPDLLELLGTLVEMGDLVHLEPKDLLDPLGPLEIRDRMVLLVH